MYRVKFVDVPRGHDRFRQSTGGSRTSARIENTKEEEEEEEGEKKERIYVSLLWRMPSLRAARYAAESDGVYDALETGKTKSSQHRCSFHPELESLVDQAIYI